MFLILLGFIAFDGFHRTKVACRLCLTCNSFSIFWLTQQGRGLREPLCKLQRCFHLCTNLYNNFCCTWLRTGSPRTRVGCVPDYEEADPPYPGGLYLTTKRLTPYSGRLYLTTKRLTPYSGRLCHALMKFILASTRFRSFTLVWDSRIFCRSWI